MRLGINHLFSLGPKLRTCVPIPPKPTVLVSRQGAGGGAEQGDEMLSWIRYLAVAGAIATAASVAYAAAAPASISLSTPSSARVGSTWHAQAFATNNTLPPGSSTLKLRVTVIELAKAGNGNGRTTSVFQETNNHVFVSVDIPLHASGWATGAVVIAEATTTQGASVSVVRTIQNVSYTTGSGRAK